MAALQKVITAIGIQHPRVKKKCSHAVKMLTEVGLTPEQMKRPALQLSDDQQQRITIAKESDTTLTLKNKQPVEIL
ncbi:hypothetical protein [Listeria riparia]|uniref:ABC transporter ATP-binding protein n=1 Tax=Listeria riparia FSL S10-1204 TaxID=1265816 RepID=W7D9N6_9LIST|nr:hypothetical protein [Listeria riparia]EUJ44216.1 ABC transporter ATP-binding protein [Listeria riparia FSL S10-1204]